MFVIGAGIDTHTANGECEIQQRVLVVVHLKPPEFPNIEGLCKLISPSIGGLRASWSVISVPFSYSKHLCKINCPSERAITLTGRDRYV